MATSVLSAVTYAQQLAQTDANGISSVLGLALYNDALQTMTRDLVNRGIDAAQTQEAYRDIGTDDPNTYLWPSDMFMLKTIEVDFTGKGGDNYIQASPMDVANIQGRSFSWIRENQPTNAPLFDNRGDSFELLPRNQTGAVIANGIRIIYFLTPTEATNVEQAINYPQTLDYRTLSCLMASLYYDTQEEFDAAGKMESRYQERMNKIINILAPSSQQPISPTPLGLTGWNY